MFYLAQLFGVIALCFLIISFQKNDKDELLKYQIFSSISFAIQYLLLNAITGVLMNLMSLIRNIIYKKFKEIPFKYIVLIIIVMIILSIFSYNGVISLLPTLAVILYIIALWQKNLKITRITEVISCCLFIIYNISVLAIVGFISAIIELCFALVAVYRSDIKGNKNTCM